MYGGNRNSYSRRLKEMGVTIAGNNPGQKRRYEFEVDENFFNHENDSKYYVLGFFFADGSYLDNGIKFDQTERDKEVLEKINEVMKSTYTIKTYEPQTSYSIVDGERKEHLSKPMCRLVLSRVKFKNQLINLGIPLNKTYEPISVEIPDRFVGSFLRGFFDGDGSIVTGHTNVVSFTIKNKENAEFVYSLLERIGVEPKIVYQTTKDVYSVRVTTLQDLDKLYNSFYNIDGNLFLERKKERFPS